MTAVSAPLDAVSLHRFYPAGDEEVQALRNVSFTAQRGEIVVVTGPSGSGKSTLLACLAGLDEPDGGTVWICGERMSRRSELDRARLRARSVGMLLPGHNLLGHLTVAENVALVRSIRGHRELRNTEVVQRLGLVRTADARLTDLSGGEAVRAGVAVALANDPAVLLADEPTGELDVTTEATVLELLIDVARHGTAVVMASHSAAVANAADRLVNLRDGAAVS